MHNHVAATIQICGEARETSYTCPLRCCFLLCCVFEVRHYSRNKISYVKGTCKLVSVENQEATDHSSKDNSFVPNLTVQTFVCCLPISGVKFAAICCMTKQSKIILYINGISPSTTKRFIVETDFVSVIRARHQYSAAQISRISFFQLSDKDNALIHCKGL